jgi:hypothetical protein
VSKQSENVMLVPGEAGWEIWSGSAETGFTLISATETPRASDLTGLPAGEVILLFPVKATTSLPLRVSTSDDSLFPELSALHAERLGLRPDPMAGQLTDQFVVAQEGENTALLSVILRAPVEGEMPTRGPKEFDLSARAIPYVGESLVIWKEFNRWVFALSVGGKLAYSQATSIDSPTPDENLVREIRLSLIQLSLQGLDCQPSHVVLYAAGNPPPSALVGAFGAGVQVLPKPAPLLPDPRSKLLPADVRAARRAAQKKQQIVLAIAALVIAYLGLAAWSGYGLWKDSEKVAQLRAEAREVAPEGEAYAVHVAKWNELGPVVDISQAPVELLYRVASAIPPGSGLRLKTAEMNGGEIKLIGEALQPKPIQDFSLALTKSNMLVGYTWENQQPNQTAKGWDFVFTGHAPGSLESNP